MHHDHTPSPGKGDELQKNCRLLGAPAVSGVAAFLPALRVRSRRRIRGPRMKRRCERPIWTGPRQRNRNSSTPGWRSIWMAFYSDETVVLPPNDKPATGKESIRKAMGDLLAT